MGTLVEQLVDFANGVKYDKLPKVVVNESKRTLLDSLGCALGGLSIDKGKIAVRSAHDMGGAPEARVIGTGDTVSMSAAAFANGELINALDYDVCTIPPGHATPFILPAVMAVGEKNHVSGKDLICAIAIAHEISARFGPAMAYYRDVKPGEKISFPAVSGYSSTIFGGVLAAGILAGMDKKKLAYAMGIAGHIAPAQAQTKWSRTPPATPTKYLLAGWICQAELLALQLAEGGYTGDIEVLEGDYGFWRYMGSGKWNPDALTNKLGIEWRSPAVTIYKPYPCCRIMHTILDCTYSLVRKNKLTPDEIEEVETYSDPHCAVMPLWQNKDIQSSLDAQMSVPYVISAAVNNVTIGPEWQDLGTIADKNIVAFMDKVKVFPHAEFEKALLEDSRSRIGKVVIKARGKKFTEERKYRKGSPATKETYMTDAEVTAKFKHNAARVLPSEKIEAIPNKVLNLEKVKDVSELAKLW